MQYTAPTAPGASATPSRPQKQKIQLPRRVKYHLRLTLVLQFWQSVSGVLRCRVPNSLAIFPAEIYLRRPHNQNTQNRLYFWTHDCHFFNNVTPFYFKYIYFSDPKVFCLGLIQSLFEGSMYSFVLEWTPALTTGKATYNYRFFMFLSTVKIKRTLLECLCI